MSHKLVWVIVIALAIAGVLALAYALFYTGLSDSESEPLSPIPIRALIGSVVQPEPDTITLALVGDIMLDRGVEHSVMRHGNGDFSWLFASTRDLREVDILFGNLEGPVSDLGRNVGSIYSFRMQPAVAGALATAGFDILSLANNHIGDWTLAAALDTKRLLLEAGIEAVGLGSNKSEVIQPVVLEKSGQKIGWLAFSDVGPNWLAAGATSGGIILAADPDLPEIIAFASQVVDHLLVSFHFGNEYEARASLRQRELARLAIDHGARVVVGHHPHVAQEVERYQDGLIAYSLGNFIFDQDFSPETMRGLVLELELSREGIKSARTRASQLDQYFRPTLANTATDV